MKTKFFKLIRQVSLASLILPSALAANYQGVITNVTPYQGMVFVAVGSGNFDGNASQCPFSSNAMVYSFDPTTPFGKAMLSVLITAKVTGKLVYLYSNGVCTTGTPYTSTSGFEGLIGVDLKG